MKFERLNLFSSKEEFEKAEKLSALDELFQSSQNYKNSKKFLELIKFISRFPSLSPFNAFLVYTQNPGVQIVLTENKWGRYKRKVKFGARPLVILMPFGPVAFVYDIADTEGPEIPEYLTNPFATKGSLNISIYNNTLSATMKENIIVKEDSVNKSLAGYARRENNKINITLSNSWGINEKYSTLVHELGHIFSGHLGILENRWWKDRASLNKIIKEIEAESITYLVCTRLGLKTTSDEYLSTYINKESELPEISFETILTVSGYIEQMTEKSFRPRKSKN